MKINNRWLFLLSLLALSMLHLWFAVQSGDYFSGDDFAVLAYFKTHSVYSAIPDFLSHGDIWGFRKITGYIFFAGLYRLFSAQPLPFILFNHLLHTGSVLLVFLIVFRMSKDGFKAFFSGLIFNSLYLHYFSNIHEYSAVFFALLSVYTYLVSRLRVSLMLFILAIFSKEISVVLPLVLSAFNLHLQRPYKSLIPYLLIAGSFTAYQIMTAINRVFLPASHPYALAWPGSAALSYYISPLILVFLFFLAFLSRAKTGIFLFAAFVLSLLPVLFLAHRQEDYYFYLPLAILSLFLGFTLPRLTLSTAAVYMAVFFIMGGRHIFPPLARTRYPNWQLVSINQVIDNIRFNLKSASASASIAFSDMRLERDANLMLGSQVVDLFLPVDISQKYDFSYNQDSHVLTVVRKD